MCQPSQGCGVWGSLAPFFSPHPQKKDMQELGDGDYWGRPLTGCKGDDTQAPPQPHGRVRLGLEVSRFPHLWVGGLACAESPRGVEFQGPLAPSFFSTSLNKKKLIKKEYCRLSASPHSHKRPPPRARPPLAKGGQANWRPSLGPQGSASPRANKPPLHCGGVPSHWRPSLVAPWHSEGGVGGEPGSGADGWPDSSRVQRWGLFGSEPTGG